MIIENLTILNIITLYLIGSLLSFGFCMGLYYFFTGVDERTLTGKILISYWSVLVSWLTFGLVVITSILFSILMIGVFIIATGISCKVKTQSYLTERRIKRMVKEQKDKVHFEDLEDGYMD